jgi:hypothetical protein
MAHHLRSHLNILAIGVYEIKTQPVAFKFNIKDVPDRPLVRVPIRTLLEYSYELGVWDFDPVHILILIEV